MTYVVSGVRGNFTLWKSLLSKFHFGKKDFLFVIGDFTGNPDESFDLLEELSYAENIWPVATENDRLVYEMLSGFDNMLKSGAKPDAAYIAKMQKWSMEGGREILDSFRGLDADMKEGILDYLSEMPAAEKVTVNGKDYLITSKGIDCEFDGEIADYDDANFFSEKACPTVKGYKTLISGSCADGCVKYDGDVIMTDCGAGRGGRLCALRLEDGAEYYAL